MRCACPTTNGHVTAFDERERVWRYECMTCRSTWNEQPKPEDAELIRALRGSAAERRGKPESLGASTMSGESERFEEWPRKIAELGEQHVIFQQALWVALEGREIGLEATVGPDGVRRITELGSVEIVHRDDGSVLVRRGKPRD